MFEILIRAYAVQLAPECHKLLLRRGRLSEHGIFFNAKVLHDSFLLRGMDSIP